MCAQDLLSRRECVRGLTWFLKKWFSIMSRLLDSTFTDLLWLLESWCEVCWWQLLDTRMATF